MQTDLRKILSVSGQHGLYEYVAQARNGIIAESLSDKKRIVFDAHSRVTTLADISIFTKDTEVKLSEVFVSIKNVLGDAACPDSKASDSDLKAVFTKALPDYDEDRFYVSHMRKVVDWYNELVKYASLDFVKEDDQKEN